MLIRVAFVLLTFAGGAGVVLYVAAWLLVPEAGSAQRIGWDAFTHIRRHNTRELAAAALVVAAVVLLADAFRFHHEGAVLGVVLLAIGVVLLVQHREQAVSSPQQGVMAAPPVGYAAGSFAPSTAATPVPDAGTPWPAQGRLLGRRRHSSALGLVTVAAALLGVGVAALLDNAGVVSVSVAAGASIALLIVGVGLIAGTWFGRSRMLILLGVLLVPLAATANLVDEPLSGGTGNVVVAPQHLADVRGQYHLAVGQLTVDLSQVPLTAGPDISVSVAVGRLTVILPAGTGVQVQAHAGAGHIDLFGATDDGVNIDSSANLAGGTLHLTLRMGIGEVDVRSAAVPAAAP